MTADPNIILRGTNAYSLRVGSRASCAFTNSQLLHDLREVITGLGGLPAGIAFGNGHNRVRSSVAALWAAAGVRKLRAPGGFAAALAAYALLPQRGGDIVARVLPLIEIAVAIGRIGAWRGAPWPSSRRRAARRLGDSRAGFRIRGPCPAGA